ncbi:MAG: hypothetical protein JWP35_3865 [Caulobacter sp.]|nr:hypothetical protein [Caulobacter sp.]
MGLKLSDTVFAGFNVIRREPLTVVAWGVAYFVLLIVSMVGTVMMAGGAAMMKPTVGNDPQAALGMMGNMFGVILLMIPVFLIVASIFNCAVYRSILRPEDTGFARLRLGADELRQALVLFTSGLLFLVGYIVCAIVGFVLMMVSRDFGALVMVLVILGYWVGFYTYFSFAGPMTFAKKKFLLFAGGDLVGPKFWPLLGCYALLGVIVFLLYLVVFAVQMGIVGASMANFQQAAMRASPLTGGFTTASILSMVISGLVGAFMIPILIAPAAVAYRDISGPDAGKQADVFA